MLLIKTYLSKDRYGGIGCFAGEFVKKGQHVWTWDARIDIQYKQKDFFSLPQEKQEEIRKYGYSVDSNQIYVEFNLDNCRHINHSETPTIIYTNNNGDENGFAACDIEIGTELTDNYYDTDPGLLFCGRFLKEQKH